MLFSLHVRIMRAAISPRFAIKIFLIMLSPLFYIEIILLINYCSIMSIVASLATAVKMANTHIQKYGKWHRNAYSIFICYIHPIACLVGIVNNIVMTEHDSFWKPVVPDVYFILMTSS